MCAVVRSLVAAPFAVHAQPVVRNARIGFLGNGASTTMSSSLVAFRQAMRELGWVDGQNFSMEYRWADGDLLRLPALAAELAALRVDVILTAGASGVHAARRAGGDIPVVAAIMGNPVALGVAASLSRPGGSVTGLAVQFQDLVAKQLQLLKDTVPKTVRVGILDHVAFSNTNRVPAEAAARALGVAARVFEVRDAPDYEAAFKAARSEPADVMLVLPSPGFNRNRVLLAKLAAKYRIPAIYENAEYVDDGGLMSYCPNFADLYRRAAGYVDRILRGARPGDLPVQQPERFELVVNLKTANALGLAVPPSLLLQATRVIR